MSTPRLQIQNLVEAALDAPDDDAYWQAVRALQLLGTEIVFDVVASGVASASPDERRLAADVLGQLGFEEGRPFIERVLPLLDERSRTEDEAQVLASVVIALGHQEDARALPGMIRHVSHPDDEVREAVAMALSPIAASQDEMQAAGAVPALAALMEDRSSTARDWATFALALSDIDGPGVRDLLIARLDDPHENVQTEAVWGLARRHDRRVLDVVVSLIESAPTLEHLQQPVVEAASLLGAASLLDPLVSLRERSGPSDELAAAIEWCDPAAQERQLVVLGALLEAIEAAGVIGAALSEDRYAVAGCRSVELGLTGDGAYDTVSLLARSGGSVHEAARLVRLDQLEADDAADDAAEDRSVGLP